MLHHRLSPLPARLPACHLSFLKDIRHVPHPGITQCVVPTNTQAQRAVHLMRLCRHLSPHPEGSPGPSRQGSRSWPAPSPPAWDSAQPPPFMTPASLETAPLSPGLPAQHSSSPVFNVFLRLAEVAAQPECDLAMSTQPCHRAAQLFHCTLFPHLQHSKQSVRGSQKLPFFIRFSTQKC